MSTTNTEGRRRTGWLHDDDGNLDDRRVAGWCMIALICWLSYQGVVYGVSHAVELVQILVWPTLALMGATVAEKFRNGPGHG